MIKNFNFLYLFVISITLLAWSNFSYSNEGEKVVSTCLGCHGVKSYGNIYPSYRVPKLANQHKDYIVSALNAYKSGLRKHPTMQAHAMNLNDKEIEIIADYFSSIKSDSIENIQKINQEKGIKEIEEIAVCVACHGKDGISIAPSFPNIAGQHEDYIYHSLKAYKNGTRNNAIMLGIAAGLSDDQMKKLSKYYSSFDGLEGISKGYKSE